MTEKDVIEHDVKRIIRGTLNNNPVFGDENNDSIHDLADEIYDNIKEYIKQE